MQSNDIAPKRARRPGSYWRKRREERGLPPESPLVRLRKQERNAAAYARVMDIVNTIKLERGCADCGYNAHPAALDFDHLPGETKLYTIGKLCRDKAPLDAIKAEIAKCEVVCSNCHRIRTCDRRAANAAERTAKLCTEAASPKTKHAVAPLPL
jgi:hypothetical protein